MTNGVKKKSAFSLRKSADEKEYGKQNTEGRIRCLVLI
jgi:hypothetical protein